jgi:hypothetical protein
MTTLKGDRIVAEFIDILNDYVESRYGSGAKVAADDVSSGPAEKHAPSRA